ncbi:aldo/keto reductase [Luedemannella helvata]|uniref:Aldo/keto reductase n=1 Tax=Luedemannella helvata TaxID=349315 RepID=A0ABP4WZP4_9ACTN
MTAPRWAGVRAGRLALGTAPLAGLYEPVSDAVAAATLSAAWDGGVRLFDTAPHYGAGLAERRLGEFLRGLPRDDYTVVTKVGRLLVPGRAAHDEEGFVGAPRDVVRVRDYSADGVRRSLAESLERLGLDRVDVALIHDPDEHWAEAVGAAYPALAGLRDEGVVRAIGAGMNQSAMLTRFVRETDIDVVLVAGRYTLLDREAAADLLPACGQRGVGVLVGGAFNSGILADPRPGARYNYAPADPAVLARARAMQRLCAAYGVPLAAAAVQFPLRHPAVSAVVAGMRGAGEVREDLALLETPISAELWTALEDL